MRLAINGRFLFQEVTGVQRVCREVIGALDQLLAAGAFPGVDARLLVPGGAAPIKLNYKALSVERVGSLSGHAWEQLELPRVAGDDILLCLGNLAPLTRLLGRRKTIVMVHDLSYRYFPSAYGLRFRLLYSFLMPLIMRRAARVITVSQTERRAILKEFPTTRGLADRLIAASNGGLPGDIAALARSETGARTPFALYVGSLSKRKNIEGVLAAAVELVRERGLPFVIVGGAGSAFAALAHRLPADVVDKITFLGQVDDFDRLAELYRTAAVFIFPSFYESSGLPPLEAMAFGCPVVVSQLESLIERCGDAAEYCDPHESGSIAAAVRRVLDDPERAAQLADAGLKRAAVFTWENQARRIMACLLATAA